MRNFGTKCGTATRGPMKSSSLAIKTSSAQSPIAGAVISCSARISRKIPFGRHGNRGTRCVILQNFVAGSVRLCRNLPPRKMRSPAGRRTAADFDGCSDATSPALNPVETAISRKENLVWQSLEEIPELYREPLVLFYREDHSIAEVAESMDLSEDAVKQRLSRGRAMLRNRVAEIVDGTLKRTRPTKAFTVTVMAGITASAGSKIAFAGTGAAISMTATTGTLSTAGKLTLGGVLGGAGRLSAWTIWRLSRTCSTKAASLPQRAANVITWWPLVSGRCGFVGVCDDVGSWTVPESMEHRPLCDPVEYLPVRLHPGRSSHCKKAGHSYPHEASAETDPNPSSAADWMAAQAFKWEKRHYVSYWKPFGFPLIHLNAKSADDAAEGQVPWTTGWIAVGDKACGSDAMGGIARGGIAIGGLAYGLTPQVVSHGESYRWAGCRLARGVRRCGSRGQGLRRTCIWLEACRGRSSDLLGERQLERPFPLPMPMTKSRRPPGPAKNFSHGRSLGPCSSGLCDCVSRDGPTIVFSGDVPPNYRRKPVVLGP